MEADAQTKLTALENQITELLQRRRRHQELTDPAVADQMAKELAEANGALRKLAVGPGNSPARGRGRKREARS